MFAKLFNYSDNQIVMMRTRDEENDTPAIEVRTLYDEMFVKMTISKGFSDEQAADNFLAEMDEDKALKFINEATNGAIDIKK